MEMLRKLAVPFLMLSLAAFGCGSSSSSNTDGGKGGSGGSSGGAGGAAGGKGGAAGGSATGGATGSGGAAGGGAGGAKGGAGGGATDSGAGGASTDGGGSDTSTGSDAASDGNTIAAQAMAKCLGPDGSASAMEMDNNGTPFSTEEFCALFEQVCGAVAGVTITPANCTAYYNGLSSSPDAGEANGAKGCRSYHLCNAARVGVMPHCYHAEGRTAADAGDNTFCP
jgi:hypothetical protein